MQQPAVTPKWANPVPSTAAAQGTAFAFAGGKQADGPAFAFAQVNSVVDPVCNGACELRTSVNGTSLVVHAVTGCL